jgi:chromosome segregation ATPase
VAFLERCDAAAREAADRDAVKVRERFEAKMARVRTAIERAEDRVDQLDVDTKTRRSHELIAGIGDVIGAFFGGKRNTRSITTAAKGASSRRATSSRTAQRLRTAEDRVEEAAEDLEELEQDLLDELAELNDVWEEKAKQIEGVEIGLEQTDVTVDEVALLWVPTE